MRLNRKKSTKKAQGLKASSPASTSVKSGSDKVPGSTLPKSGSRIAVSVSGADVSSPSAASGDPIWRQKPASPINCAPIPSASSNPVNIRPQTKKAGTDRASSPSARAISM
jgi:hypothetical protein